MSLRSGFKESRLFANVWFTAIASLKWRNVADWYRDLDRTRPPSGSCDQPAPLKREDHVVHGRRRHLEVALKVRLCRRASIQPRVSHDECQILTLKLRDRFHGVEIRCLVQPSNVRGEPRATRHTHTERRARRLRRAVGPPVRTRDRDRWQNGHWPTRASVPRRRLHRGVRRPCPAAGAMLAVRLPGNRRTTARQILSGDLPPTE